MGAMLEDRIFSASSATSASIVGVQERR
jgi:hypothetical protein